MSAKPTLETLDVRVGELEEWKGSVIKRINENGVSLDGLSKTVGKYPTEEEEGSGMALDVTNLIKTVGEEPSKLKGTDGSGMAKMLSEVHSFTTAKQGFWPGIVTTTKSITIMLSFIVAAATVLSGCAAVATYLIRVAVVNSTQIAHPTPAPAPPPAPAPAPVVKP